MKHKSLALNAVLNAVGIISGIIFPLITFPYVSRVLHVDNIGIYNYCASINNYFCLFAALGIETYAIREGAKYREDREAFSKFASEVFTINVCSMALSYLFLLLLLILAKKLQPYVLILSLLSSVILFNTIGCGWVFSIYEEYAYITIRNIVMQLISLALLILFVHDESDLIAYVLIIVATPFGANMLNLLARRRYGEIGLVFHYDVFKRLRPILLLFFNNLAISLYVNADMTMLGALCGTYYTGLYTVSTKVYFVFKSLLASLIIVSVPRLSAFHGDNDEVGFQVTAGKIFDSLFVLVFPIVTGLFSIAPQIVLLISSEEYIEASLSLQILALALMFCMFSYFYISCILIPCKCDKKVLMATLVAAVLNIGLNLLLIPRWKQNAAAFTTVVAEFTSFAIGYYYGRRYFRHSISKKDFCSVILGNILILLICKLVLNKVDSLVLSIVLCVTLSASAYAGVMVLMKNSTVDYFKEELLRKIDSFNQFISNHSSS